MPKLTFSLRGLSWALAAVLAVAVPAGHSAYAVADKAVYKLLAGQLPAGVTLAKASIDQTVSALHAATTQRPDEATSLVQAAILAKTPKQGEGKLDCPTVDKFVRAAMSAAPDKSREIIEMAASLEPDCADALNAMLANNQLNNAGDVYGNFGIGFGPGFPGSPGFTGSSPSGAIALPPFVNPVTTTTNG